MTILAYPDAKSSRKWAGSTRATNTRIHRRGVASVAGVVAFLCATQTVNAIEVVPNIKLRPIKLNNLPDCDNSNPNVGEGNPYTVNEQLQVVGEACQDSEEFPNLDPRGLYWDGLDKSSPTAGHDVLDLGECGQLSGTASYARWINNDPTGDADVAGYVTRNGNTQRRAFLWQNLPAACTCEYTGDCNACPCSLDCNQDPCYMVFDPDTQDFPSASRGVNDGLSTVGWVQQTSGVTEAFIYSGMTGTSCILDDAPFLFSVASVITNGAPGLEELIVGSVGTDDEDNQVGIWRITTPGNCTVLSTDLMTLTNEISFEVGEAWGASDNGHVAGFFGDMDPVAGEPIAHAFLYRDQDGGFTESTNERALLTAAGSGCDTAQTCPRGGIARAVNDAGRVVGNTILADDEFLGALWDCSWGGDPANWSCTYADIHQLIDVEYGLPSTPTQQSWLIEELWGINERGAMVGYAEVMDSSTPPTTVEEPGIILLPLVLTRESATTLRVDWAEPDADIEVYYGCSDSSSSLPVSCSGKATTLELVNALEDPPNPPSALITVQADSDGTAAAISTAGSGCAGSGLRYFQAVDTVSCVVSNVLEIPYIQ